MLMVTSVFYALKYEKQKQSKGKRIGEVREIGLSFSNFSRTSDYNQGMFGVLNRPCNGTIIPLEQVFNNCCTFTNGEQLIPYNSSIIPT